MANFVLRTGCKKSNLLFPRYSPVFLRQVKATKLMHILYVDIPRMPFQNRFQACFDCRMFLREKSLRAHKGRTNSYDWSQFVSRNI